MRHPAVVVDLERDVRLPLVPHRAMHFGRRGDVGWWPEAAQARTASLSHDAGRLMFLDPWVDPRELAPGETVVHEGRGYRVDVVDDIVLDARRMADLVIFNAARLGPTEEAWRGFSVGDPARALLDVRVRRGGPRAVTVAPASDAVPLGAIANLTRAQRAGMDEPIARSLVTPLLRDGSLRMGEAAVTWDGRCVGTRLHELHWRSPPQDRDESVRTFHRLAGTRAPVRITDEHVSELEQMTPAPAAVVAAFVRALFADAWALEESVREQVGMIDPRALRQVTSDAPSAS